jgi:hypothetical protein
MKIVYSIQKSMCYFLGSVGMRERYEMGVFS